MTARVPGAINVPAASLSGDMIVPLATTGPRSAQSTLGALAAFFEGESAGGLEITPLATVGAGSLTAAGIVGGITTRSGAQSNTAFTDTTVAASAIIAAMPEPDVGDAFIYRYVNNTDATATLAGGSGVTLAAAVPANTTATFYAQYTAADTMVFTLIGKTAPSLVSGTVTANGVTPVPVANTNVTANSVIILSYKSGTQGATGAFVSALTAGSGFSIKSVVSDAAIYNYLIIN